VEEIEVGMAEEEWQEKLEMIRPNLLVGVAWWVMCGNWAMLYKDEK
jgi:hypothetical protein